MVGVVSEQAINGANNDFGEMLKTIMEEHDLSQLDFAARLGVSQPALGRWCRGHEPSVRMRELVMAKLREPWDPPPTTTPAEPVNVSITGNGMDLKMRVSFATAQQLFAVLFK